MKKILRSIGVLLIACACALGIAACEGSDDGIADNTEHFDAVTKTLKLNKSYEGKCFFTDGIGKAKVASFTDGDTTLFTLEVPDETLGSTVNIRYYAINTPESTGSVEKWGKAASLFTKGRLEAATEIVLEATKKPAEKDNYGTRYLAYVWYKTADYPEFKNLNLEIVENGFSDNKGANTSAFIYNEYFNEATKFARKIKLRLYSELEDPLFSDAPVDMTIKKFNENPLAYYNEELDAGSKVRFTAYLRSLEISKSGTYTFTAEELDTETGETYSINVYTGYNGSPASSMKLGYLYQIVGVIQKHDGVYQVAGPVYALMSADASPTNTHIKQRNYFYSFDSDVKFTANHSEMQHSNLIVSEATVSGGVLTIKGSAQQMTKDGYKDAKNFTVEVKVAADYQNSFSAGNVLTFTAYKFDANKDVLTVIDVDDIQK